VAGGSASTRSSVLTQISRFDRLRIRSASSAYQIVKRYADCQLVLAGMRHGRSQGAGAWGSARGRRERSRHARARSAAVEHGRSTRWRASTIVIQKSLRGGFRLTVAEGLWKKKPWWHQSAGYP
jgi:trehalose synthase